MIFVFKAIFFFIFVKLIPNEDSNGKSGIFLQKTVTENQRYFLTEIHSHELFYDGMQLVFVKVMESVHKSNEFWLTSTETISRAGMLLRVPPEDTQQLPTLKAK